MTEQVPATEGDAPEQKRDIGFCFKCGAKRYMGDVAATPTKNNRMALRGACTICGSGITKIGSALR